MDTVSVGEGESLTRNASSTRKSGIVSFAGPDTKASKSSITKKESKDVNPPKRKGSVYTTIFTKLLHDNDPVQPDRNAGVWVLAYLQLERDIGLGELRKLFVDRCVKHFKRFHSVLRLTETGDSVFDEIPIDSLDMDYHMPDLSAQTRNWTLDDVFKYIGELNEYQYDLNKPLWRYLLIPQLNTGQAAIIACVNHAIGDGLALVEATERIYDPIAISAPDKPVKHQGKKAVVSRLDPLSKLGVFLYGIYHGITIIVARPDPPNPLRLPENQSAYGKKALALAEPISLERVKEIKNKMEGTTINDVLMGLMTMALKAFFIEENRYRPGERVTAQFPISMRGIGEGGLDHYGEPHNKISYAYFDFNFEGSRENIIWHTKQQIDCIKISPSPILVNVNAQFANKYFPRPLMLSLVKKTGNLGSAQLSNVPAPQGQVSVQGIQVVDMSFFLFSPLACYLGILTYNGTVNAAFNLDSGLNVDPKRLARHWNDEFEKLYEEINNRVKENNGETLKEPPHDTKWYRDVAKIILFALELVFLMILMVPFPAAVLLLASFIALLKF